MTVTPLGDSAAVIQLGGAVDDSVATRVRGIVAELERHGPPGVVDIVPAYSSVAIFFDPNQSDSFATLAAGLAAAVARADEATVSLTVRTVEIPVAYGGDYGPDLTMVARHTGLSPEQVIQLHSGAEYQVHAIGFAPGFPYLGGLPRELETPRRDSPRARVPAGSIGIGGIQTGIYPCETPGGWNLIGRTPRVLFDPRRAEPALLRAGDRVRFQVLASADFDRLAREEHTAASEQPARGTAAHAGQPEAMKRVEVLRPGMWTTLQDTGRRGHRAEGVPLSGAADAFALRVANSLVGNSEDAAVLEFTLVGPALKFVHETVVAIGGAKFGDWPCWRPFTVPAGTSLDLGAARTGCRGYLAVAGGFQVEPVLGSRSTYVRAALGGLEGRPIRTGDVLLALKVDRHYGEHWRIDERIMPRYSAAPVVRIVSGAQAAQFDPGWTSGTFTVRTQSDRMGVRLAGNALSRIGATELISSPVAPGTIQVPPDGQPIVLLADAQTIGGYPQVAHVISVDLPLVAQLRPGDTVRFRPVTLEHARELIAAQERALGLLREGLAQKLA